MSKSTEELIKEWRSVQRVLFDEEKRLRDMNANPASCGATRAMVEEQRRMVGALNMLAEAVLNSALKSRRAARRMAGDLAPPPDDGIP